jgi:hypothetical protein
MWVIILNFTFVVVLVDRILMIIVDFYALMLRETCELVAVYAWIRMLFPFAVATEYATYKLTTRNF